MPRATPTRIDWVREQKVCGKTYPDWNFRKNGKQKVEYFKYPFCELKQCARCGLLKNSHYVGWAKVKQRSSEYDMMTHYYGNHPDHDLIRWIYEKICVSCSNQVSPLIRKILETHTNRFLLRKIERTIQCQRKQSKQLATFASSL